MNFLVDDMKPEDWDQVSSIYLQGINSGISTFQKEVPGWKEWDRGHCKSCRLVARAGSTVLGWAALSPVSGRCVYSGVAEVSIYVRTEYRGSGIGTALLEKLVQCSEENGFWTLQAGIIRENEMSIGLHKKCGFRMVGIREKLGKMDGGKWHDVVLMERRSRKVGI